MPLGRVMPVQATVQIIGVTGDAAIPVSHGGELISGVVCVGDGFVYLDTLAGLGSRWCHIGSRLYCLGNRCSW